MDAAELRALQAPIKERYKVEPKADLIMLHQDMRAPINSI